MGTSSGIWVPLQKSFLCAIPAGAGLAILGKGRGRVLILLALFAAFAADTLAYVLQMD